MRITFLGNFRVDYSSESHHKKSLESLGHEVVALQETEATAPQILDEAIKSQLFIWVHTHNWKTPGVPDMATVLRLLKNSAIPTVTYHLDLWLGISRQNDLNKDPVYKSIEHFFTVDRKMADWFNEHTEVKGHYLQAGVFGEECYMATPSEKKNDVVFVGSKQYHREWQYRPQLINWLEKTYGPRFKRYGHDTLNGVVRGKELNQLYADTRVVVGDSLCVGFNYPDYWSDRVYETLGRGGFLIHPRIEGMEKTLKDGWHLMYYDFNDWTRLKKLIDFYIDNDEPREKMRLEGHNYVKENHTYKHRWQQILQELGFDAKEWNGYYAR